jgi:hypothetical protein
MIADKRRQGFPTLLGPKTRTSQSRHTIVTKKPGKVYGPHYKEKYWEKNSVSNVEDPTTGGESVIVRLWPCLVGKWPPFGRRNEYQISLMTRVL